MNLALPPSSHIAGVDNSNLVIAENLQAILALVVSEGMLNLTTCVDFMVMSSVRSTFSPLFICLLFKKGHCTFCCFMWCSCLEWINDLRCQIGLQTICWLNFIYCIYLTCLHYFMHDNYYHLGDPTLLFLQCGLLYSVDSCCRHDYSWLRGSCSIIDYYFYSYCWNASLFYFDYLSFLPWRFVEGLGVVLSG